MPAQVHNLTGQPVSTPPRVLHPELPTPALEVTSSLADALSSAFNQNAEEEYPSPRTLANETSRHTRSRDELTAPAPRPPAGNIGSTPNVIRAVGGRRPIQVWQPELVEGPRATKGRQRSSKTQKAIEDFLDVQYAPNDLGHRGQPDATGDGEVQMVISQGLPDMVANRKTVDIHKNTMEDKSLKLIDMNLRHIFSSRTSGANSKSQQAQIERPAPYAVSTKSYTAMYLERVGEWLGDHDLDDNITEADVAEQPHGSREYMVSNSSRLTPRDLSRPSFLIDHALAADSATAEFDRLAFGRLG